MPELDALISRMLSAPDRQLGVEPSSIVGLRLATIIHRLSSIEKLESHFGSDFYRSMVPELADIEKCARQARLAIERAMGTVED